MSRRPDVATALEEGETLLWQGAPKRGRPTPLRANLIAAGLYALTLALAGLAWYVAVFRTTGPAMQLLSYALVAAAAFSTFMALRITLLDTRRVRARDAHTAYGITDRRVLSLAGPHSVEMRLEPGLKLALTGDRLEVSNAKGTLRLDRLSDAEAARDILQTRIGALT